MTRKKILNKSINYLRVDFSGISYTMSTIARISMTRGRFLLKAYIPDTSMWFAPKVRD